MSIGTAVVDEFERASGGSVAGRELLARMIDEAVRAVEKEGQEQIEAEWNHQYLLATDPSY